MQDDSSRPSGLHDHTGYWLNRLRGLVHGHFEAALAGYDITVAQWSVLITVYREDADTPQEIAQFVGIDAGALTRLIDRLEAKGLIRRVRLSKDRRSVRLELTARALAITPQLASLADANDQDFFDVLSAGEHRQFRKLLGKLLRNHGVEPPE